MKKRVILIAVIVFAIVIIPIAVFQTIKLATRPASISLEEALSLPLEEGQKLYTAGYDEDYDSWYACHEGDVGEMDPEKGYGYANLVIENDFYIRHFQDKGTHYVIIVHDTGEETMDGFRIVVADAWYVLEKADE